MTVWEGFSVAFRSLSTNLLRSALTLLGIIIGVAAVIATVAIGDGAHMQVTEQMRSMGSNLIMVKSGNGSARSPSGTIYSLTEADAEAIRREIPAVQLAASLVLGPAKFVHRSRNWNSWVRGTEPDYFIARNWQTDIGQHFTDQDVKSGAKVTVLGATVAEVLFEDRNPVGRIIRISKVPFTVVGVLKKKGPSGGGQDRDNTAFVPLSTAKIRLLSEKYRIDRSIVAYIIVKIGTTNAIPLAKKQIHSLLRQRHQLVANMDDEFTVQDWAESRIAKTETVRTLRLLLFVLSTIAFIVGGISIMNIMLASVTERTREIGLRLAVGARPRDIWKQFLIEAIALCLFGGCLGVLLGLGLSFLFAKFSGWPVMIGPNAIGVALGLSGAIGVLFGIYPALRASRLDAITALRAS